MRNKKNEDLIIGIIFILLTKVLDWSNIFLFIGLIIVFDALFRGDTSQSEEPNDRFLE